MESAASSSLSPEQQPSSVGSRDRLLVFGIFVVATVVTLPPQIFPSQQVIAKYRVLDTSWQLSMPMMLRENKLSGRDFIYTYGPVYQFTQALGLLIPPGDLASVSRFRSLPERAIVLGGLWWVLSLTGATVRFRGVVFLMWCVIMAAPVEFHALRIKPMAGVPAAALCGLLLGRAQSQSAARAHVTMWLAWGAAGPLLTLYSFDFGIIFTATLFTTALISAIIVSRQAGNVAKQRQIDALTAAASAAIGMTMLLGGTQLIPGWEHYTPDMFALVTAYGNAMAMGGTMGAFATLAMAFCASGGLLLFWLGQSPSPTEVNGKTVSLQTAMVAIACFAMFMVRYGMTRTDWFHVFTAVVPTMFLFGCLLPALSHARQYLLPSQGSVRAAYALPLLILVAPLIAKPFTDAFLIGWGERVDAMLRFNLDPTSIEFSDETLAQASAAANKLPNRSLFVWPYGVEINLLANKNNPSYTLQSTEGALGTLEDRTIKRLKKTDDVATLLYRDAQDHTTMSRNSDIFRYLLQWYKLSNVPEPGFAFLQRQPRSATWKETGIELPSPPPTFKPDRHKGIQISLGASDTRVSDILVARVQLSRTSNFPVGKPGICFALLILEDGTRIPRALQVQPDGESHDVLICGLHINDDRCLSHFVPNRTWRTTERVKLLQFGWQPYDILSKPPAEIRLERLAVLRREGVETRETPMAETTNPDVWQWCYGSLPKLP